MHLLEELGGLGGGVGGCKERQGGETVFWVLQTISFQSFALDCNLTSRAVVCESHSTDWEPTKKLTSKTMGLRMNAICSKKGSMGPVS